MEWIGSVFLVLYIYTMCCLRNNTSFGVKEFISRIFSEAKNFTAAVVTMQSPDQLKIKLCCAGAPPSSRGGPPHVLAPPRTALVAETRRFLVENHCDSFANLVACIEGCFSLGEYSVMYEDEDGDQVRVASDLELLASFDARGPLWEYNPRGIKTRSKKGRLLEFYVVPETPGPQFGGPQRRCVARHRELLAQAQRRQSLQRQSQQQQFAGGCGRVAAWGACRSREVAFGNEEDGSMNIIGGHDAAALRQRLVGWRLGAARVHHTLAYMIISEEYVNAVSRAAPRTLQGLAETVDGYPKAKLEKYGPLIVAEVGAFLAGRTAAALSPENAAIRDATFRVNKITPKNHASFTMLKKKNPENNHASFTTTKPQNNPASFEQQQQQHFGVVCDGCGMTPIRGVRHKSKKVPDYDLCGGCLKKTGDVEGVYLAIETPRRVLDAEVLLQEKQEEEDEDLIKEAVAASLESTRTDPFEHQAQGATEQQLDELRIATAASLETAAAAAEQQPEEESDSDDEPERAESDFVMLPRSFAEGSNVELHSLSATHLNGKLGKIVVASSDAPGDRLVVELPEGTRVSVKPDNLLKLPDDEEWAESLASLEEMGFVQLLGKPECLAQIKAKADLNGGNLDLDAIVASIITQFDAL